MALDLMRVVQGLTDDAVQLGFIGIVITQYKVGEHGAGTHQWNLPYSGVVYSRQVNLLLGYYPSLPRWFLSVDELWRHRLQRSMSLHQIFHPLVDKEGLPTSSIRRLLLDNPIPDRG